MPERKPPRTADLDYFYGQSSELFSFYRIPKLLFQDINKRQFEDGLRQNEPSQRVDEMLEQAETIYKESEVPEYERFSVREVVGGTSQLFAIWDDLNEGYYRSQTHGRACRFAGCYPSAE